jgi:hypothetical protein
MAACGAKSHEFAQCESHARFSSFTICWQGSASLSSSFQAALIGDTHECLAKVPVRAPSENCCFMWLKLTQYLPKSEF